MEEDLLEDASDDDRPSSSEPKLRHNAKKSRPSRHRLSRSDQIATSNVMDVDYPHAQVNVMDNEIREDDTDDQAIIGVSKPSSEDSTAEQTAPTDDTSVSEDDDEAQLTRETQGLNGALSLGSAARSRRSRPRMSYVETFPDAFSDQEPELEVDEDDSDVYNSDASAPESVTDEEFDEEGVVDEQSSAAEDDIEEDDEEDVSVVEISKPTKSRSKSRTTTKSSSVTEGKGIDFNLPPIDSVEDAFADMAVTALELGLADVLQDLAGHQIEVATMCSGTESPLLAFDLLSKALVQAGHPPLQVHQKFAAEIEVFKQAFIERNQSPETIFRDVREFIPDDATTAITAYGAEEPIPSGLDVLIAGFVCKDLSRLNTQPKGLEDNGESGDTWRAIYSYAKRFRPSIVLLENVKGLSKLWDSVVTMWDEIGYEAAWLIRDTKRYRIPQTRERMYMVAIERSHFGKDVKKAVVHWQELMDKLQRQCSSPYESWLNNMLHESSDHSALNSEVDWALCKLRYDHIRSDERLGILRPVTKWSENGTVRYVAAMTRPDDNLKFNTCTRPPDFANRAWYNSQSSRVYDAIDVAYLQAASKGHDQMYKMAVLDVSQNVDRFKTALGILPCITPGGCDFATNRQEALSGKQLLLLQGMPLNKLLFGTETQKECQDLAGNAMTTTVIGASIISAIICGWRAFRSNASASPLSSPTSRSQRVLPVNDRVRSSMKAIRLPPIDAKELNLEDLKHDAVMSARLCNCEGEKSICKSSIRVCSGCGHTACERCAGNPKHQWEAVVLRSGRMTPNDFVQKWRPRLSTRFKFGNFPNIHQLVSALKPLDKDTTAFIDHVVEAEPDSQYYCFQDMLRQDIGWTIIYGSTQATLELRIGHETEWLLFINCPKELPGNDPLRRLFRSPIARAKVVNSLLDLDWEICFPSERKHKLQISGVGPRCSSWRSRLGLLDFKDETIPTCLQIETQVSKCNTLVGEFELLPECGTASSSLYRRLGEPNLYLFLDPDLLGKSDDDGFVFSHDCRRKPYGDSRISLASLGSSWRPWHVDDHATHDVETAFAKSWIPASMNLRVVETALAVSVSASLPKVNIDCSHAVTILEAQILERLPNITEYSWVLERAKRLPSLSTWQPITLASVGGCACAPVYPRIMWHVNEKGVAVPHEARKAAAEFERAMKTRAPIFHVDWAVKEGATKISVSVNVAALVHRAKGRIAHTGPVDTAWSLYTDHAELPTEPFPKFHLQSNSDDRPFALTSSIAYLRNAQPRALSWMKAQEIGRDLTVTEIEEAIHADLGWRMEARAQTVVSVRGGVLADLPSFGKTVTTIALIQSEFEQFSPDVLLQKSQQPQKAEDTDALLDTAATLIVCPAHIALQWKTELKRFLGDTQYDNYNVIVVQTYAELQKLNISDIQSSRVVVLAWTVFAEEDYISDLAHFTAMPQPSVTGRRAFDTWFGQACRDISHQLITFQSSTLDDFRNRTESLLAERLQHEDFKVTLPIKIQHGSAYQSFNASKAKSKLKRDTESKLKGPKSIKSHQVPLIHLFRFNRVVVDEYHYLNDDKILSNVIASVSVKRISAVKRWVLSGTPALANFSDVDQIASYLGLKLGRYHFGNGVKTTQWEKTRRGDQTLVEDFLSQTEIMSRQWHQARHERAQEFLDLFVRQNEPCLRHVACVERITPSELDIGHHAIYLELSQYVGSHRMAIKKLKNKICSDKIDRLNASLSNSATAEDALLKSALIFRTSEGKSALEALTELRSSQRHSVQTELRELMAGFEALDKSDEISELYNLFKEDITKPNWLGDDLASRIARNMLIKAKKTPDSSAFPELKGVAGEKKGKLAKKRLSSLRETARDLAHLIRSERFISAIQTLLGPLTHRVEGQLFTCSSPECDGTARLAQLRLITHCGHTACEKCLSTRVDAETCVEPLCNLFVQGVNLVRVTDLGSRTEPVTERYFGRKMENIIDIISNFPKGDQGVVFAPNNETVEILQEVLDCHDIPYHSLLGCRGVTSAKIIEDFKANDDPDDQSKVLLLNMGCESAAGA